MNATSTRTALWLAGVAPLAASILTGCVSTETTRYVPAPAAVVVTPPPPAPAPPRSTVVMTAPADRISYPEGRYVLYNDSAMGTYWAWVPAGASAGTPPAPPPLPRVAQSG